MGQRGPKKTPNEIKAARGSWRADDSGAIPEPDRPEGVPEPPQHLEAGACEVWRAMAPKLVNAGVMASLDLATFERYCRTYHIWRRVAHEIAISDEVDRLAVSKLSNLDDMLRRLERSFGLNPADRQDLSVETKGQNDGGTSARNSFMQLVGG